MKRDAIWAGTISPTFQRTVLPFFVAWPHYSPKLLCSLLFWFVTQSMLIVVYRRFGASYLSHLHGWSNPRLSRNVRKYYYWTSRNNPRERSLRLHRSGSPKSRLIYSVLPWKKIFLNPAIIPIYFYFVLKNGMSWLLLTVLNCFVLPGFWTMTL